ncbi:RB18B protein, partial [Ptilorrhoa leucosticta]|nr:RB18B protein [Ptilorrhoa leucosticta]
LFSVYDVTRKHTFTGLERWLNELEIYTTNSNTGKMLVGNKTDKVSLGMHPFTFFPGLFTHQIIFFPLPPETSAKTQDGAQHAFEELVIKILQTPGLWGKSTEKWGVQLMESSAQQDKGFCGAYCPLT